MNHEYIINYEVWQNGILTKNGNQTIGLWTASGPPSAQKFLDIARRDIMQRADCTEEAVRVVGVFKL
jgi:hypothetical protein